MIKIFTRLIPVIAVVFSQTVTAQAGLETDQQKFSYAIGVQVGQNIAQQGINIDQDALIQGISDVVKSQGLKLTVQEMQAAVASFQAEEEARFQVLSEQNKQAGEAFLAENKTKRGVTELANGIQYIVENEGDGERPDVTDTVVVHYRGALIDGTEFDSSYSRGEPLPVSLEGVIPGWQEIVPLMKVGSKWQVFIPAEMGYGENAAGPVIGPNSTLVFDIELLSIEE